MAVGTYCYYIYHALPRTFRVYLSIYLSLYLALPIDRGQQDPHDRPSFILVQAHADCDEKEAQEEIAMRHPTNANFDVLIQCDVGGT